MGTRRPSRVCVLRHRRRWRFNIPVMPGRNGNALPYGWVTSTNFKSVTGWLGFGNFSDADLTASVGNISGYPGDKPSGTQRYDARRIATVAARKVYCDIDTAGGQSGSAVYRIVNGHRYGCAVQA